MTDTEEAEAVVAEQCPSLPERFALLRLLVASAELADTLAPDAWAVTLFANGFRLNVGQIEAVVFTDGELRVNLSGSAGTSPFVGSCFVAAGYRSLPQPLSAFVGTVAQYLQHSQLLVAAHKKFIDLAATKSDGTARKGTPFRRSHSEALMQYARAAVAKTAA